MKPCCRPAEGIPRRRHSISSARPQPPASAYVRTDSGRILSSAAAASSMARADHGHCNDAMPASSSRTIGQQSTPSIIACSRSAVLDQRARRFAWRAVHIARDSRRSASVENISTGKADEGSASLRKACHHRRALKFSDGPRLTYATWPAGRRRSSDWSTGPMYASAEPSPDSSRQNAR